MFLFAYGVALYVAGAYRLALHWFGEALSCCESDRDFRRAVAGVVAAPVAVPLVVVASVVRRSFAVHERAREWHNAA